MIEKITAVKGMNDLLPGRIEHWHRVESVLRRIASLYGYEEIRTPALEKTELFRQSIGDQTDIVEKEMYVFEDAGGVSLTLRPEATASTVRAGIQHGLFHNRQQRLWYMGPMFRRERPQRGRYRQFHQFGIEAFGWPGPEVDAEVIRFSARVWKELKLQNVRLEINTLGSVNTRARFRNILQDYFTRHADSLDEDSRRRLERNPLRILDSKDPKTRECIEEAPSILDVLEPEERRTFETLKESLERSGIEPVVNPHLVRGLDYYSGTVFEWLTSELGAQSAICAGGRYDGLVESRGGRPTPGVGFAMGLERLVELMSVQDVQVMNRRLDVYVISLADQLVAARIAETLRDAGLRVREHCGGGKLSKIMKRADQSGARIALIHGHEFVDESPESSMNIRGTNLVNNPMGHQGMENVKLRDLRTDRSERLMSIKASGIEASGLEQELRRMLFDVQSG